MRSRRTYASERGWPPGLAPPFLALHTAGHSLDPSELNGPEGASHMNVPGMPAGPLEVHELEPACPDSSSSFYVFVHAILVAVSVATVRNSIHVLFAFPPAPSLILIKTF